MENKAQNGFLMLADISGYTSYMANAELEHAHEIISELLDSLIKKLTSLFTFAEVEGDAIFVFANESKITRGETLLELIEDAYFEFCDMKKKDECKSSMYL